LEAFNALVQSPWVQPLMAVLLGVVLLLFFWWRAGSIRSVLDRVWHLVAGRTDVNDPILKELLVNSRDLERFQFTYRLKAESLADVHKLHAWSKRHRVDIAHLSKAREWVDLTQPELIKEPHRSYVAWRAVLAIAVFVVIYLFGALLLPSGAVLQMKASGTYFRLQEASIEHPYKLWAVGGPECKSNLDTVARDTGFTRDEAALICKLLEDGQSKELIDENVAAQRWLFLGALIFLAPWFLSLFCKVAAAQAAIALRKRTAGIEQCEKDKGAEP
jgi:hypothetical protein